MLTRIYDTANDRNLDSISTQEKTLQLDEGNLTFKDYQMMPIIRLR